MSNSLTLLMQEIEFILAERSQLEAAGPHFRIWHSHQKPHSEFCLPGEEIAAVWLIHGGREFPVPLIGGTALLFDFLGRRRMPMGAAEIAVEMNADPFYLEAPAQNGREVTTFNRALIKAYIHRIRKSLEAVFTEAGLQLDPYKVLVSEMDSNAAQYALKATVDWVHSKE